MENNTTSTFVQSTVAITIGVLVLAMVLVPIVSTAGNAFTTTGENEDYLVTYSSAQNPTVTVSVGAEGIEINDYVLGSDIMNTIWPFVFCDNWMVFSFNTTNLYVIEDGQNYDGVKASTDVTLSDGTLTYTKNDNTTVTKAVTGKVFYASKTNVTDVGYRGVCDIKFNANSDIKGTIGNISYSNDALSPNAVTAITMFRGTYEAITGAIVGNSAITSSTCAFKTTPLEENGCLSASTSYTASVTTSDGTYTNNNLSGVSVVPLEYKYTSSDDNTLSTILSMVPLFVGIGILLGAVALFLRKKG